MGFSMLVYYVLLAVSPIIIYICPGIVRYISKKRRIGKVVDKIPGPKRHFFFGNIRDISQKGEDRLQKWYLGNCIKYKTAYSYQMGPFSKSVALCHPSTVKVLLKTAEPKMTSEKRGYSFLLDWLGKGLLINDGPGWFRNRRLLTPAFHFETLKPYMDIYNEAVEILLDKFSKASQIQEERESIEIYDSVSLCTLDVMLRCAFSFKEDIQTKESKYVKTVGDLARLAIQRALNPFLWPDVIYKRTGSGKRWKSACDYAHEVAYDLIRKRKAALAEVGETASSKQMDFLDILLLARDENNEGLLEHEMREEVDTFLFEGHDTTASAISWCLYMLAAHPESQTKAREEVDDLLKDRDSDIVNWSDLNKIPYTTMCIKESLRHTPAVPAIGRELENPLEIDGVTLEPGTPIAISIYGVHHNPIVWGDDHMEYIPERFEHEKMKKMDSHAFIPFAAGPRNCIGQNFAMNEIKTAVVRVLRRFILAVDPHKVPQRNALLVTRAVDGIHIILKERTNRKD